MLTWQTVAVGDRALTAGGNRLAIAPRSNHADNALSFPSTSAQAIISQAPFYSLLIPCALFPIPYSLLPIPQKKPATRVDLDEVNRCGRLLRSTFTDSGRVHCPIFSCVRQEVSSAVSPSRPLPQGHSLIHTVRYQGATIMGSSTWSCCLETDDSRRCRKPTPISRKRMHESPGNAPRMHATLHETCTDCALAVRFEDSTAPYKTGRQRSNSVIPARAGIPSMSETDPNFAPTDA